MGRSANTIFLNLKDDILAKKIRAGEYLPAIRDLSDKYEVATGTVHKSLKKLAKEGLIISENRKGFRVANLSDIQFDGLSIAYAHVKPNPTVNEDLHLKQFRESLDFAAGRRGISILSLDCTPDNLQVFIDRLQVCRIGGVILNMIEFDKQQQDFLFSSIKQMQIPVVLMDCMAEDHSVDFVYQDNFRGGEIAAEYAINKGYKKFIWFGPAGASHHSRERFGGVCAGLVRGGFFLSEKNILEFNFRTFEDVRDVKGSLKKIIQSSNEPVFIFALWSYMAFLTSQVFMELNLKIGNEHGFIGWSIDELFDTSYKNNFNPKYIPPVVAWKSTELADQTIDRLLYRRRYPNAPATRSLVPVSIYGAKI